MKGSSQMSSEEKELFNKLKGRKFSISVESNGKDSQMSFYLLSSAAMQGNKMLLAKLIEEGHNVNQFNSHKKTPLHFALENNNLYCAKLLLMAGADRDFKDIYGTTPKDLVYSNEEINLQQKRELLLTDEAKIEVVGVGSDMTETFIEFTDD